MRFAKHANCNNISLGGGRLGTVTTDAQVLAVVHCWAFLVCHCAFCILLVLFHSEYFLHCFIPVLLHHANICLHVGHKFSLELNAK